MILVPESLEPSALETLALGPPQPRSNPVGEVCTRNLTAPQAPLDEVCTRNVLQPDLREMQTLLTRARLRPRRCSSLSDVPVSGRSLGPQRAARRAGSASVHEWRGCPYSPAYFLGRPPPPGNGLPDAFVRFLTKAPSSGGLHSRHDILRTLTLPFQCPPGLQPKHSLKTVR